MMFLQQQRISVLLLILCSLLPFSAVANEKPQASIPPVVVPENGLQDPQVTIIQRGKDRVEEYRVNGQLRMIKITPALGPPYYFVDNDGDGVFSERRNSLDNSPSMAQWLIKKY